jgi:hypothetical protein
VFVRETICIFQYRVNKYDFCANRGFVDCIKVRFCTLTGTSVIHSMPGRYIQHAWFLFLEYGTLHCLHSGLFCQTTYVPATYYLHVVFCFKHGNI